ncbi:MAG: flagellar biosynthetic protein FliR [Desulfobacterales bacterium]|nr:flagellar biosynthetic protein FliR [Desulfobacterales bacterium]
MEILNFSPDEIKLFILVLIRVSIILSFFPIIASPLIPDTIKAGLYLVFSILIMSAVKVNIAKFPIHRVDVLILIFSEAVIGLSLGFAIRFFIAAVQMAAQIIGFQMGYTMINVIDPQSGTQISILEQIGYWVVLLFFLQLNGHNLFLASVIESFDLINIGTIVFKRELLTEMIRLSSDIFTIAIKIGSPTIAALLFINVAFGLVAKFEPKMNILLTAFPVPIIVGLIFFGFTLELLSIFTRNYVTDLLRMLKTILKILGRV